MLPLPSYWFHTSKGKACVASSWGQLCTAMGLPGRTVSYSGPHVWDGDPSSCSQGTSWCRSQPWGCPGKQIIPISCMRVRQQLSGDGILDVACSMPRRTELRKLPGEVCRPNNGAGVLLEGQVCSWGLSKPGCLTWSLYHCD